MSPIRSIGMVGSDIPSPTPAVRRRRPAAGAGATGQGTPHNEHPAGKLPPMRITWKDGSTSGPMGTPIARPLSQGPAESRIQAAEAARHLTRIDEILRERWNRAGWDDKGGAMTVIVNQRAMGGNAYFASLTDGTGEMGIGVRDARIGFQQSPAYSPSILFHELVHGIVGTELQGLPAKVQPYLNQREHNAINESIADVLSTGLLNTNWRNGQEIRDGSPLRDLTNPSVPKWNGSVRRDTGLEEHTLAGVVSRAAVVAAESAGTLPVVDAWYAGIDSHYRTELLSVEKPGAGRALGAWVRATMRGAEQVGGKGSDLVDAMRDGWEAVGLGRYASKAQLDATAPPAGAGTKPKRRPKS
ncbi:MAG: Thermolysin metallopeptidase catalytic domain [Thermoleophilia bacterium]|nr:Thermolysin metallopeptidase catalytic domain [Thermoleophilia bacterium]